MVIDLHKQRSEKQRSGSCPSYLLKNSFAVLNDIHYVFWMSMSRDHNKWALGNSNLARNVINFWKIGIHWQTILLDGHRLDWS